MRWRTPGKGPFGAIFWKELRETYKGGIAALAIMMGLIAMALPSIFEVPGLGYFANQLTLGPVLAAFLIGRSQARRERPGSEEWVFLVYRPVRRSTLFWGKVTVGLLLYAASVGVPLLAVMVWVATPGHVPQPCGWCLTTPLAKAFVFSFACYFAVLFGILRRWRVYPSQAIAFAATVIILGIGNAMAYGFTPLVFGLGGLALMALAARATFIAAGRYEPQPMAGRIASGLITAIGLGVWGLWGSGIVHFLLQPRPPEDPPYGSYYPHHYFISGGTIMRTRLDATGIVAVDLDGRQAEHDEKGAPLVVGRLEIPAVPGLSGRRYGFERAVFVRLNSAHWSNGLPPAEGWYYVRSLSLIARYDTASAKPVGWMGPHGYSPGATPPADRFDGDLIWSSPADDRDMVGRENSDPGFRSLLLRFPREVYHVDLKDHRIAAIFEASDGESVAAAREHSPDSPFNLIVTTKAVYIQTPEGMPLLTAPRDPQAADYEAVTIYRVRQSSDAQWFVWYVRLFDDKQQSGFPPPPDQVTAFNEEGMPIHHYTLPVLQSAVPISWAETLTSTPFLPVTVPATVAALGMSPSYDSPDRSFFYVVNSPMASRWLRLAGWAVPALSSFSSAALIFAFGRKYAFPRRKLNFWTAAGVLVGPFAFPWMFMIHEWPMFERCPACRRSRIITRSHCEHCGAPFMPPEPDGTEIFELREGSL